MSARRLLQWKVSGSVWLYPYEAVAVFGDGGALALLSATGLSQSHGDRHCEGRHVKSCGVRQQCYNIRLVNLLRHTTCKKSDDMSMLVA